MIRKLLLICSAILLSHSAFAAVARLQVDTKTHILTDELGGAIIDAKGVTLTIGGFTIYDGAGVKTIVTGSTSGVILGASGNKLSFLGATPVVQQTGNIFSALAAYGLVASPSLTIANVTSLQSSLNAKAGASITVNGHALTDNVTVSKGDVGLGNNDNTSDANKPVSTAQQAALDAKAAIAEPIAATHAARTDNPHAVTKTQVGLTNTDNTSDANKPVSTAQQAAIDLKANDNAVLHLSGPETISGAKNFTPLQTFNSIASSSITTSQLANPSAPAATPIGTHGATTWSYKIVAKLSDGTPSAASPAGSTTIGDDVLDSINKVSVTWSAVTGAATYDVYRTAVGVSPSTTGKIANVTTNSYIDAGDAGDSSTAPSTNVTGQVTAPIVNFNQVNLNLDPATNGIFNVIRGGNLAQNWISMGPDASHLSGFLAFIDQGPGTTWDTVPSRALQMVGNPATALKPFSPVSIFLEAQFWNGSASVWEGIELENKINSGGDPEFWLELPEGGPLLTITRDSSTRHAQIQASNQPGDTLEFRAENGGGGYARKAYVNTSGFAVDQYFSYAPTGSAQSDYLRVGGTGSLGNATGSFYNIIRSYDSLALLTLDGSGDLTIPGTLTAPALAADRLSFRPGSVAQNNALSMGASGSLGAAQSSTFAVIRNYDGVHVFDLTGAGDLTLPGNLTVNNAVMDYFTFRPQNVAQTNLIRMGSNASSAAALASLLEIVRSYDSVPLLTLSGTGDLVVGDAATGTGRISSVLGFKPPHNPDGIAPNDTVYFSTDAGKMVYKDAAGVVHPYY